MSCALPMDKMRLVVYLRRCLSKLSTPSKPHLNVLGLSAPLAPYISTTDAAKVSRPIS